MHGRGADPDCNISVFLVNEISIKKTKLYKITRSITQKEKVSLRASIQKKGYNERQVSPIRNQALTVRD